MFLLESKAPSTQPEGPSQNKQKDKLYYHTSSQRGRAVFRLNCVTEVQKISAIQRYDCINNCSAILIVHFTILLFMIFLIIYTTDNIKTRREQKTFSHTKKLREINKKLAFFRTYLQHLVRLNYKLY